MRLVVLGATGPSGLELVKEALSRGHYVTALVRNPDGLPVKHPGLQVKKVDVMKKEDLLPELPTVDAVLSCIGAHPWPWERVTLYSDYIRVVTAAMREAGVTQLVVMSSACAKAAPGNPRLVEWVFKPLFMGRVFQDMAAMEDFLEAHCSDLRWTVVKPPQLTSDPSTGQQLKAAEGEWVAGTSTYTVPRADVVKFMLDCLHTTDWDKKCVAVSL